MGKISASLPEQLALSVWQLEMMVEKPEKSLHASAIVIESDKALRGNERLGYNMR